jgi:hypothetical protein
VEVLMLKKVLLAIAVCGALALVLPTSASAVLLCDDFGREWDITFANCADATSGKCVSGARDINDELGCGPAPVFGTFVKGVLSVVTLDDDADTCISVGWRGSYNGVSVSGSFESEVLATGPFTLGPCAGAGADRNIQADPAVRR